MSGDICQCVFSVLSYRKRISGLSRMSAFSRAFLCFFPHSERMSEFVADVHICKCFFKISMNVCPFEDDVGCACVCVGG